MRKNNILITGTNGFIGKSLAEHIIKKHKSWAVYGVDKKSCGERNYAFDITDKEKLTALINKIRPEYIFHFAGITNQLDFKKLLFLNVYTTQVLFESVRRISDYNPRVFIPASASEYGEVNHSLIPIKESCPLRPISLYGFSKMMQEELSLFYASRGSNVVIGRIFNIIGKGVPLNFAIGKFAYELALIKNKRKKPVLYTKNLSSKRDFLDIDDVCEYVVNIAMRGSNGGIYNICKGRSYRIGILLEKLMEISGVKNIKVIPEGKIEDNNECYGSTKKLDTVFKLNPKPIEESLRDTYLYYLNQ